MAEPASRDVPSTAHMHPLNEQTEKTHHVQTETHHNYTESSIPKWRFAFLCVG